MFMYYATNIGSCRKHVTTRYTLQHVTRYNKHVTALAFFLLKMLVLSSLAVQ